MFWGWAAGRAKHLLRSANLQSPSGQGRDGVLRKTQLKGGILLQNLKMLLLCPAALARSLPCASYPHESLHRGEKPAP